MLALFVIVVLPQITEPKTAKSLYNAPNVIAIHVSAMHAGPPLWTPKDSNLPSERHGGEPDVKSPVTTASCTEVCGQGLKGKSCSKICLVNVYPRTSPEEKRRMYAMLDDQSNSSLARSAFFDMFNVQSTIL